MMLVVRCLQTQVQDINMRNDVLVTIKTKQKLKPGIVPGLIKQNKTRLKSS